MSLSPSDTASGVDQGLRVELERQTEGEKQVQPHEQSVASQLTIYFYSAFIPCAEIYIY